MIACIKFDYPLTYYHYSPDEDDLDETFNTLEYAQRTQKIKNKPSKNISRPFISPQKEPVAFEMYSDSEEETEFKKMYELMKRKSSKIAEANICINKLRMELDEASIKIQEYETLISERPVVSTFTQTDTHSKIVEATKFIPKSSSMDLLEMQNLTPAIIMNHMYSSITLVDEDMEVTTNQPDDVQVLKLKADMSKSSTKHSKE